MVEVKVDRYFQVTIKKSSSVGKRPKRRHRERIIFHTLENILNPECLII